MSQLTKRKILRKLELLDEYLRKLFLLRERVKNKKDFFSNFEIQAAVERYLQLGCQVIIDTMDLVIIEENLEKPDSRMEEISLLYNSGIISEKMAQKLEDIVKFRNILVYEYGEIDKKKVYKNFLSKMEDFEEFKKEILRWLKKSKFG